MKSDSLAILGWECTGLRCPDYKVDFTKRGSTVHRVSLLQMPNGTGKTTTLAMLRATLSGKSPTGGDWKDFSIARLAKPGSENGRFILHLVHNDRRWSFRTDFNFKDNEVDLYTTGPSGEEGGFNPPRALEQFLNANFVRFFVFDGELAVELTDSDKQDAQQAIDALFQLSDFSSMGKWTEMYLDDRIDKQVDAGAGTGSTEQGIERQRNLIKRLKDRIGGLKSSQQTWEDEAARAKTRILQLENENREAIAKKRNHGTRLESAIHKRHDAELSSQRCTTDLLQEMRNPHRVAVRFAQGMIALKNSFDRVKLPENTAREWFEELAVEDVCVCGRPLDEPSRQHIKKEAQRYLGSDNIALLNRIKGEISSSVGETAAGSDEPVRDLITRLHEASDRFGKCQHEVDRIKMEAAHEDPEIDRKEAEIKECQAKLQQYETNLRRFRLPDASSKPEDCFNIQELERRLRVERSKLDEVTKTANLRWKTNKLKELLAEIHATAVSRMGHSLAKAVNESLSSLMPDNLVRLRGIEKSLLFHGKEGASVGETLTVGYAFLTHLGHRSNFSLPLVIDTPAAPIDPHIREEIGATIPKLVEQFIAFTLAPERGSFTKALAGAAAGDVQYITLFRKSNVRLMRLISKKKYTCQETADGVIIHGQEFFEAFQDDSHYIKSHVVDVENRSEK